MDNHPVDAEPIAHLAKAGGKELLSNRHQDLTAVGKGREDAVSFAVTIHSQREVRAPHRLGFWNVRCPEFSVANRNARVQNRVLPLRVIPALVGRLRVRHHHANFCSEMLLVVPEGLRAFAGEIHISIHLLH